MAQITRGIRGLLSLPSVYTAFQNLMGARKGWTQFVDEFIKPVSGSKILDVGCGPADLLSYLPDVEYWGYDISKAYIDHAINRYGNKGHFICGLLTTSELLMLPSFDIVVASGLLHHMDDNVAKEFLHLSHSALRPGGRLLTIDPCWADGQHSLARLLISHDRGQNVRTADRYDNLVAPIFARRRVVIRHKNWIPYTHCFMECIRQ